MIGLDWLGWLERYRKRMNYIWKCVLLCWLDWKFRPPGNIRKLWGKIKEYEKILNQKARLWRWTMWSRKTWKRLKRIYNADWGRHIALRWVSWLRSGEVSSFDKFWLRQAADRATQYDRNRHRQKENPVHLSPAWMMSVSLFTMDFSSSPVKGFLIFHFGKMRIS